MTSADAGRAGRSTRIRTRARTRLILERRRGGGKVTKVLGLGRRKAEISARPSCARLGRARAPVPTRAIGVAWCLVAATAWAQAGRPSLQCPQTTGGLYARIRSVGLDPQRGYHVRDASIDRPNLHLDLDDGTLAFTEDICGRITGAFFEGDGEIRLRPPNRVERGSLALFTGGAILEEQFTSGYLRFNDDTAAVLHRYSTPVPESAEFIKEWADTSRMLAEFDALRLLLDFSHFLPADDAREPAVSLSKGRPPLSEPE